MRLRSSAALVAAPLSLLVAAACGSTSNEADVVASTSDAARTRDAGHSKDAAFASDGPAAEDATVSGDAATSTSDATARDSATATSDSAATVPADASAWPLPLGPELHGVTVDDVSNLGAIVTALSALPKKPTTRVVFDKGMGPSYYAQAVSQIHAVSFVMGEILDSSAVKGVSVSAYTQRTTNYLAAFPTGVDLWEVGNEINGNWLGATSDVVAKMTGAYDLVKAAGGRTALTLYGCSDSGTQYDMFEWVTANVPARMLTGLDYVLVSYYEGDCGAPRSDWQSAYDRLRQLFPSAGIGFGEVGAVDSSGNDITDPSIAGPYLQKYYDMQIATPGYVGGYFWWYFAEDMVPDTKAMFPVLSDAIRLTP